MFQDLETVVGSLLANETDRDVSAATTLVITLLDKIEVCESQVRIKFCCTVLFFMLCFSIYCT